MKERDFVKLIKDRIKTWQGIYDENEEFGFKEAQPEALAVIGELKEILKEVEK